MPNEKQSQLPPPVMPFNGSESLTGLQNGGNVQFPITALQGPRGDPGSPGVPGTPGESGPPGVAPNLSVTSFTESGQLGVLPANSWILRLLLRNNTTTAVSVTIGTTLGGDDVLTTPQPVPTTGAKSLTVDITEFEIGSFPVGQTQTLYLTLSNNASSVNAQLDYEPGP